MVAKSKKSLRIVSKNNPKTAKEIPTVAAKEKVPVPKYFNFLSFAFLAAVVFSFAKGWVPLGELFVFGLLVVQVAKIYFEQRPPWIERWLGMIGPANGIGLVLLIWVAFSVVTLTFPNFSWMFPKIQILPFQQSFWMSLVLFIGLVFAFRLIPAQVPNADISPTVARFFLMAALIITAVLDLHHLSEPVGTFWDDNCVFINDSHRMKDLEDFRGAFIFDYGKRPPFYQYFVLLLWKILPGISSLVIMHLASTLCNLGTVCLLYLCGKEIGGKKTGVLAAALGAVSKPLLQFCILNFNIIFIPFSVALAFLSFLRLIKKPDMKHFLQWGVAVSFGMYTYLSYLPFIPLFIFTVFIWVWFQKEGRNMENPIGPVVWTTVSVFFFFFLYNNNGFSRDSWIARTIDVSGPFLPCMVLGCLGLLTVIALPKLAGEEKSSKWFGWIAGSWVCLVLSFPVMTNEQITARVNNFSFAQGPGSFVLESIQRIKTVFMLLFWQNTGDCTNALPGDSYFGYGEVIIIALGLAFFFARLNWKSCLLFIAALVGFLPNAFLLQPHTGRILGCVVPFLLLGSLGLNEVLNSLFFLSKGRVISRLACLLLLGLWGWSAQASLSRIFDQWSEKILSKHVLASQEAYKDASLGYRIYFVSSLFNANAYPLNEGNKIHLWLCPNLINLTPNDKPEDVDLILEPDSRGDNNQLLKDQLAKDFPTAHWKDLHTPNQNPGDGPTLISCVIPFSDISAYSQKYAEVQAKSLKLSKKPSASTPLLVPPLAYFEVRQTPMPCWDRQYSTGYFGLAFDLISYEDKATNAQDPGPKTENGGAVRCEGIIHVDGGGNYEMNWKTVNRTEIQIDGRTLLNVYFPQTNNFISPEKGGMKTIRLDPGDHQVKVTTCFQQNCNLPDISLNPVGQSGSGQSLWSSYKF